MNERHPIRAVIRFLVVAAVAFSLLLGGWVAVNGTDGIPVLQDHFPSAQKQATDRQAEVKRKQDQNTERAVRASAEYSAEHVSKREQERADVQEAREYAALGPDTKLESVPSEHEVQEMKVSNSPLRLKIPAVGMNVRLKKMSTYPGPSGERVINPPRSEYAYLVRDYGSPDNPDDMTVIAMHSLKSHRVPGNLLFNTRTSTIYVHPGDKVYVGSHEYLIKNVTHQRKQTVAESASIWKKEPGKLLIFTCLQRPQGKSQDNIIIEAHRVN